MTRIGLTGKTMILALTLVTLVVAIKVQSADKPAPVVASIGRAFFLDCDTDQRFSPSMHDIARLLMFGAWLCMGLIVARNGSACGRKKIISLIFLPPLAIAGLNFMMGVQGDVSRVYPGAIIALIGSVMYEVGYRFNCTRVVTMATTFGLCVIYAWAAGATSLESIVGSAVMALVQYVWADVELRFCGYTHRWNSRHSY